MCHLWSVQIGHFPACFHAVIRHEIQILWVCQHICLPWAPCHPALVIVLWHYGMHRALDATQSEVCPLGVTSAMPQDIGPKSRRLFLSLPHHLPLFLLSAFLKCRDSCQTQPKCTHKTCSGRSAENDQISGVIHILPGEMEHAVNSNWYHIHTHSVIWGAQLNYSAVLRKVCDHTVNDIEHAQGEEKIFFNVWLFLPSEWLIIFRMP